MNILNKVDLTLNYNSERMANLYELREIAKHNKDGESKDKTVLNTDCRWRML